MNKDLDLLDFLKYILDCECISDLKTEPYNTKAKLILDKMDYRHYSLNSIKHAIEYVCSSFENITNKNL